MKQVFYFVVLLLLVSCGNKTQNTKLSGSIFGTFYEVTYHSKTDEDFQKSIDSLFYIINKSMSTYQTNSDISKLNRNEPVEVDQHFRTVFKASKLIHKETNGIFDPTIGAVVNAWDFGPEGRIINLDSLKIDSLMLSVGLNKVKLIDNKITKPQHTFLDFNAIAKGYAVDIVGEFLESKNIENYLVNIGGELTTKGINIEKQSGWKVGIEHPNFDGSQSFEKVIELKNESMATSGTYRKFKIDTEGKRYAHIIDAKTGYPSKTNLLSISVIAENCMIADAYATAFQAMGIEKIKALLAEHPELKVFLIFENDQKEFETLALNGFPEN
ncbi:FAD:protein FMN transferase [Flavobacteriaceae bacterium XHP0103]|uniref:FAD:protein FMN transferase n=1 Tax=Marixanthotalea marina TaxID=2844359 RepID=UPI002989E262|nr:FAD:protein FMN transferase [Marixanthotalea marina]MBU3822030.1 FAD:protein FMN transferase [Marixanthotalea marina]